jgi:hypothetical protein
MWFGKMKIALGFKTINAKPSTIKLYFKSSVGSIGNLMKKLCYI